MSDKYSETTIKSYGERIKSGFFASIFGLILFVLSFVVLFLKIGLPQIRKFQNIE